MAVTTTDRISVRDKMQNIKVDMRMNYGVTLTTK